MIFRTLLYKEILDHLMRFRFVFAFLLCSILVVSSLTLRALDHKHQVANYQTSSKVFDELSRSHQQSIYLGIEGIKIVHRPEMLAVLVEGVTDFVPDVTPLSIFSSRLEEGSTGESPLKRTFESIDFNFIIRLIMSLLALLFSYDAIAGERERGTLRAVLANSLPRSTLLLAKIVSGFVCVMIPLVFSTCVGLVLVHIFSGDSFSGSDWLRFGLIFLVSAGYVALFYFMGLLLSIFCRGSKTALLSAFFVWIIFILIIPNLSGLLAAYIRPVPSRTEMMERKRLIEAQEEDKVVMRMLKTSQEGGTDVIARDSSKWAFDMATTVNTRLQAIEDAYNKQVQQQSDLAQALSLLSPASTYSYIVMDLAGTGLTAEMGFREQIKRYAPTFIQYIKSKIESEGKEDILSSLASSDMVSIEDMPRFQYQTQPLADLLRLNLTYFAQLLLYSALLMMGCFIAFARSDVRDEF